jgi:exodeoxyribonuclease III
MIKVITWNCNMAFRKKAPYILEHNPDLLIIPECEHPDKLLFPEGTRKPTDTLWFGKNQNKGLAIISYNKLRLKVLDAHNENFRMIVPIAVKNGRSEFILFAIWANNPEDKDGPYVTQVWKALHCYEKLFANKKVMLVGDFNSNTIWDRPRRIGNHSHVVEFLEKRGISSTYHAHFKLAQGKEQHPTYYLYKHIDKPYHLDYCFVSSYFAKRVMSVEVGDHSVWSKHSDHVPVIITLK